MTEDEASEVLRFASTPHGLNMETKNTGKLERSCKESLD